MPEMLPTKTLLAKLPAGSGGHFLLHFYAVLARMLANLQNTGLNGPKTDFFERFPFLASYQASLHAFLPADLPSAEEEAWWETQMAQWEQKTTDHLPLRALVEEAGLSTNEVRLLTAAGIVEEDIRFGSLFASLQEPLAARRPCIGLLNWLLGTPGVPSLDLWRDCQKLCDAGFLQVENRNDPCAEWVVRVPAPIWGALRRGSLAHTVPGLTMQRAVDFPQLETLILPDALQAQMARIPDLLKSGQVGTLVLRGMTGSGRRTVLGAIASALGRDLLLCETGTPGDDTWRLLGPLATLAGAMPALRFNPGPGETLDLPPLAGYAGPVGISLGRSGGLRGPLIAHSLSLSLPQPDAQARHRFWQATEAHVSPGNLEDITRRFLLTGGHIFKSAALAQAYARLDNRDAITAADVQQATRALNRQALETLATALEPMKGWSDLIVSQATLSELRMLEARCQERETLREQTGPALGQGLNRGVRALFSGPSGTGKTLAARVLAAVLQMDLYRIDLAAVVNKYIGETERNLNQVLSRAEELDVILLLDEGDALMTSRTEVRNANDRYANLETNYLLQRLETYEGVVIITTNAGNRIDKAFMRRLDVIIDFAPPEAAERWLIWQSHLPASHSISQAFVEEVAGRCALTGGQIRNAALHATLLAVGDGSQIDDGHLEAAVRREYRKAGAACPLHPRPTTRGQIDRLRQFASEIS